MRTLAIRLSVELAFYVAAILAPLRVAAAREFTIATTTDFYCSTLINAPTEIRPLLIRQFKRAQPSVVAVTLSRKRINIDSFYSKEQIQDFFMTSTTTTRAHGENHQDLKTKQMLQDAVAKLDYHNHSLKVKEDE